MGGKPSVTPGASADSGSARRRAQARALRAVSLVVHVVLAVPFLLLMAFFAWAVWMTATGPKGEEGDAPRNFFAFTTLLFAMPTVVYVWLIQRWWRQGAWKALTAVDVALCTLTFVLAVGASSDLGGRIFLSVLAALSAVAASTVVALARRLGA